jgi:TM2 domain-containing membrane protein YozV
MNAPKSIRTAYLLWLVGGLGCLGLHRFYLGKRKTAFIWMGTAGVLGVGALADALLLRWLVRRHNRVKALKELRRRLKEVKERKQQAIDAQHYPEAASLRDSERLLLEKIEVVKLRLKEGPWTLPATTPEKGK